MDILEMDRIRTDLKKRFGISSGRADIGIRIWGAVTLCVGAALAVFFLCQGSAKWLNGAALAVIGGALIWLSRQRRKGEQALSRRIDAENLHLILGACTDKKWEASDDSADHYLLLDEDTKRYWVSSHVYDDTKVGDQILFVFTGKNDSPVLVYNLRDWELGDSIREKLK